MTEDWLDDLLDRHPGEPVPPGFAQRLRGRIEAEEGQAPPAGRILRPVFGSWLARSAAGLLLLAVGFWLGRDQPEVEVLPPPSTGEAEIAGGGELSSEFLDELDALYQDQALLDSWELLVDEDLELGLRDATLGTWELEEEGQ